MKVSVELGDDVLRVVDELATRSGRRRDEIIAEAVHQQAVRQQTASAVLVDLLVGRDDGLSDDEARCERATCSDGDGFASQS